jgi:glutaredoxin 3
MKDVRIYTTQTCPYCVRAKDLLRKKGVAFQEVDVTGDDAARVRLVELADGRKTVPQVFIEGAPVGGYSDLVELQSAGKLDSLLGIAP